MPRWGVFDAYAAPDLCEINAPKQVRVIDFHSALMGSARSVIPFHLDRPRGEDPVRGQLVQSRRHDGGVSSGTEQGILRSG